ncbi:replicative DNA helicase [Haloplasma contractile]|uniref:Replicative DNA helicase n=1 Tax=Haloplasma contractile SSD-17B TaxID=1033810 RepID=U2EEC3_9MOLU|nr:replicative DNA helicase [Haloplasma contractile]ERJ13338.1 Replicative DNA helicase protein [Haloplasma contractile SSD-17B]
MAQSVPHNIEAEQSILGAIFLDNRLMTKVSDLVHMEDFYQVRNQLLYGAMVDLHEQNKPIDVTTITTILKDRNQYIEVGGTDYILEIAEVVPTTANIESYVEIVREKSVARKLIDTANSIAQDTMGNQTALEDLLDDAERKIMDVARNRRTSHFKEIKNVVEDVFKNIQENAESSNEVVGLKTGFKKFDELTLGIHRQDLFILAARPAMGKTALVLNLAKNVVKYNNNEGVAIFSLEMGADQLVYRMLTAEAQIDAQELRKGKLDSDMVAALMVAKKQLASYKIYIDDTPGVKIGELRAKCRRLSQEGNLGMVVIDYLQLLAGSGKYGSNRQQEVSEISRTLKEIARELEVPVIACAQLSRQVESREDKRPIMSDLRESGSIEQDADIVSFLYRDDYYNENSERPGQVDIIFAKHRHGPTGTVSLFFNKQYSSFADIDDSYMMPPMNQ